MRIPERQQLRRTRALARLLGCSVKRLHDAPHRTARPLVVHVDQNQLMDAVLNQHHKPRAAAKTWLKAHPTMLEAWLAGVGSRDGQDGLTVASARLAAQKQFTNPS